MEKIEKLELRATEVIKNTGKANVMLLCQAVSRLEYTSAFGSLSQSLRSTIKAACESALEKQEAGHTARVPDLETVRTKVGLN